MDTGPSITQLLRAARHLVSQIKIFSPSAIKPTDRSEPPARWIEEQARSLHCAFLLLVQDVKSALIDENAAENTSDVAEVLTRLFQVALAVIAGGGGPITSRQTRVINLLLGLAEPAAIYENIRLNNLKGQQGLIDISLLLGNLVELMAMEYTSLGEKYEDESDIVIANINSMGLLLAKVNGELNDGTMARLDGLLATLRTTAASCAANQASARRSATNGLAKSSSPSVLINGKLSQNGTSMLALQELIGLSEVKQEIKRLASLARVFSLKKERGLPVPDMSLHLVFVGNPGTGKTTVARIIANVYRDLGLLTKGQLIETDRAGLVGGYVGQTAIKTKEVLDEALGGVLFIDEAYSLNAGHSTDFGQEAIDTLLKFMEDHRNDLVVIVAGYTERMQSFIQSNPGLQSRFSCTVEFANYDATEMGEIFDRMLNASGYRLAEDAQSLLSGLMEDMIVSRGDSFANARDVRKFFERTITNQASRLDKGGEISHSDLVTILANDLPVSDRGPPKLKEFKSTGDESRELPSLNKRLSAFFFDAAPSLARTR